MPMLSYLGTSIQELPRQLLHETPEAQAEVST